MRLNTKRRLEFMHILVTGHTGFKGTWLLHLLTELGHQVSGYSLPPRDRSAFVQTEAARLVTNNFFGDVRDGSSLDRAVRKANPDVLIHLAAQPLVLESYRDPETTYSTNVQGTQNVLSSVERSENIKLALVITTDKVYRDIDSTPYHENSPLGGDDPYSASKAMADILTQSWGKVHSERMYLVARAGNVIGAYDDASDRIIPDIISAYQSQQTLKVRHPDAIRPWQHVLDCLSGYLNFIESSLHGDHEVPNVLNFGPLGENTRSVMDVVKLSQQILGTIDVQIEERPGRKETNTLTLDSSLANNHLGWFPKLNFEESVRLALDSAVRPSIDLLSRTCRRYLEGSRELS